MKSKCPACGSEDYMENEAGYVCHSCLRAAVAWPKEETGGHDD